MSAVVQIPDWLRAIYPFEPQRFETGRGALSYLDEGRGDEALLMVHGNPTWSFYYRKLVLGLRGQMRCIVPDHLGCGLSEKPQDFDYTLSEHIRNLGALVDHLRLRRVHLVVHDWGGPIGLGTMLPRSERLGTVTILNTAAFADTRIPLRIRLCRAPLVGELLVRGFNGFAWPATWMAVARPLPALVKRGYLFPYDSWNNRIATHRFVTDIPTGTESASGRALAAIESSLPILRKRPTQLIWGGKDFCFDRHYFGRWQVLLPDAPAAFLPDVGHYVADEGGDVCVEKLRKALGTNG